MDGWLFEKIKFNKAMYWSPLKLEMDFKDIQKLQRPWSSKKYNITKENF